MTPENTSSTVFVVGTYARFSNDGLQRDSSIEDQVRTCTEVAEEKGWVIDPSLHFSDYGASGARMATREGIQTLLKRIESDREKAYHGFIFDCTSRLGRNLAEVLQFCKLCDFHGIFLFFVNQQLDSRDPNFYQLLIQYAQSDENHLKTLKHSVKRGQIGRIKQGMTHGGHYYGFRGVAIPDPTKRSTASKVAILGVKFEIEETEAPAIRAIFNMADQGMSYMKIALACRDARFPRPPRKNESPNIWTRDNVRGILLNPMNCGYLRYGRTTTVKHPVTGKVDNRLVEDESKWTVKHFPELAIVSVEQWERVQSKLKSHKQFGVTKTGGLARRKGSDPMPVFSGLLFCADCPGAFVVTGRNKDGSRSLQCRNYRFNKTCSNSLNVSESELEERLIDHIVAVMLTPDRIDSAIEQFHTHLNSHLKLEQDRARKASSSADSLVREQCRLENEQRNIIASLREFGPIKSLKTEFTRINERLRMIADLLKSGTVEVPRNIPLNEARQYIHDRVGELKKVLLSNRPLAQQAIRRVIGRLTLSRAGTGRNAMCRIQGGVGVCK